LRGRAGTESAAGNHAAGDSFALLDGSGTILSAEAVGDLPNATVVAISLGDSQPVSATIGLRGIGFRPPSPVHPRWSRNPDGSHRLTWVRRARGGWLWQDGVDVPLGEQSEAYDVTFGAADQTIARWEPGSPELVLTSADLAALLAVVPVGQFAIRQRGDRALSQPLLLDPPSN
jgi:hypothetical protein